MNDVYTHYNKHDYFLLQISGCEHMYLSFANFKTFSPMDFLIIGFKEKLSKRKFEYFFWFFNVFSETISGWNFLWSKTWGPFLEIPPNTVFLWTSCWSKPAFLLDFDGYLRLRNSRRGKKNNGGYAHLCFELSYYFSQVP